MIRRLLIIESPGSGKSTLAAQIASTTGLPLINLDNIYWQPNWTKPEQSEWLVRLALELAKPAWIIDGNYGATLSMRLRAADAAVMLDYPTAICLARTCKRIFLEGHHRKIAPGCTEHVSWTLLRYIWHFRKKQRPQVLRELQAFPGRKQRITSPRNASLVRDLFTKPHFVRSDGF